MNIKIPAADTQWWIDVGLEFFSEGLCLQWQIDSHYHIAKDVLGIREADAIRITSLGSSKYQRDFSAHFTGLSDCRIKPGTQAEGVYHAQYFQMHTTDKSITYHPEGHHHGNVLSSQDVLKAKGDSPFCSGLYSTYVHARGHVDLNAHLEVWVISKATLVLTTFSSQLLWSSLIGIPRSNWWDGLFSHYYLRLT